MTHQIETCSLERPNYLGWLTLVLLPAMVVWSTVMSLASMG